MHNRASEPIQILGISTTCGCTTSLLSHKAIQPHDKAVLALNYRSGTSRGDQEVSALVLYKQGNEKPQMLPLQIRVRVDPDYDVQPDHLDFVQGIPSTQRLQVSPRHVDSINIKNIVCNRRFFAAAKAQSDHEDSQVIEVSFNPEQYYADAGPTHVAIHTDNERQPILKVPLRVSVPNQEIAHLSDP